MVSVQRDRVTNDWWWVLKLPTGETTDVVPVTAQWFMQPYGARSAEGVTYMTNVDDDDGSKTLLLQRYRAEPVGSDISAMDDLRDLPGFMLWLEDR